MNSPGVVGQFQRTHTTSHPFHPDLFQPWPAPELGTFYECVFFRREDIFSWWNPSLVWWKSPCMTSSDRLWRGAGRLCLTSQPEKSSEVARKGQSLLPVISSTCFQYSAQFVQIHISLSHFLGVQIKFYHLPVNNFDEFRQFKKYFAWAELWTSW